MLNNLEELVVRFLETDPEFANDPLAQQATQAIRSGNPQAIEQMGTQLANQAGMSPQDIYIQGMRSIGL